MQCLSSYPWGWVSDRIGRKPVILFGTTATAASMLGLGLSWTYWMAAVARSIGGLLNGIIGALKTIIAESFDEEQQAQVRQQLQWQRP